MSNGNEIKQHWKNLKIKIYSKKVFEKHPHLKLLMKTLKPLKELIFCFYKGFHQEFEYRIIFKRLFFISHKMFYDFPPQNIWNREDGNNFTRWVELICGLPMLLSNCLTLVRHIERRKTTLEMHSRTAHKISES
ncbi:CLUMA_CG001545, isoform A [Clunio marinus]|uniref:CLUMA_CG001545, isoform A n=1 Tax=Clunio marinus TaxID=568069 RepID=A0A1J1HI89_9DIPT|nr:CLUMA_CG001545, isoform A [Clunio marinus]